MSSPSWCRPLVAHVACVCLALLTVVRPATAEDPEEPALWEDDPRPVELEPERGPLADLWIGLTGTLAFDDVSTQVGAMLVLGGKLDAPLEVRGTRAHAARFAKTGPAEKEPPPILAVEAQPTPLAPLRARPRLGKLARGTVKAALAAAGSAESEARLSGAATRARASGLVPELRLRVAHVVDEDQRLAPTEYDPERITASGGTSLWLEARATFQLDRLVFADDEIALERLRADRAKLEAELIDDVLKSLEAWMRAGAALESEIASEEERLRADVDEAVAEARLDALTAGWFSTQRAQMKSSESLTTRVDDAVSSF
ncbi:MAG: hypothetical protein IPM79_17970 [Polyangiaceae bacterium]|jgi:hypothetical protein|nr:hypothetical protein [Polyangiaceae bacterium]MBK8939455.1 hypothetical protein [Polyangiaceae bacterium]